MVDKLCQTRTRRSRPLGLILIFAALLNVGAVSRVRADDELEEHLATLRQQVEDRSVAVATRSRIALEMAATLDRAAQGAPTAEARRALWTRAIGVLDEFRRQNAGDPRERQLRFQAAVYLWARSQSWAQQWERTPADDPARGHAIEDLDLAIGRLRALEEPLRGGTDSLAENVRYRLAQALADRSALDPSDPTPRRDREREALRFLDRPIDEPALRGYALLLRGELLGRLGQADEAMAAIEAASKVDPGPPLEAQIEAKVDVLLGRKRFDDALKAIEASKASAAARDLLAVRVLLAKRDDLPAGEARTAAEAALFRKVEALRASKKPEAREALIALARGLIEPDASQGPDAWDALAEGFAAVGDPARAGALEAKGADRAEALGRPEQAAAMRLRAGAFLFQAGRFTEADAPLGRVVADPNAGASRPRAGLLRILARGRALATKMPGASQRAYVEALEAQIRDFPDDPSAGEARWLLGKLRLATSERDAAASLWSAIPRHDPRWLDARLAAAGLLQDELDTQRLNNDRDRVKTRHEEARSFLSATAEQARDASERAAVQLALARLELTPGVGSPDEARQICERLLKAAGTADQRDRAQRLHVLALGELGRFVEAEQEARDAAARARPADLLEIVRLIDHSASEAESDLRLRRFGLILRVLLGRVLEKPDELSPEDRAEARLRMTRALIFSGDDARARASLDAWQGSPPTSSDRLLDDLADTYARLEAHDLAADVHRLRARRAATGSLPWFAARYGLALAYYRSGKAKEARQLIDATAILHPDLGGGELRDKFVRLRQRLDPHE
jgi:hypothetical protein